MSLMSLGVYKFISLIGALRLVYVDDSKYRRLPECITISSFGFSKDGLNHRARRMHQACLNC